jgi:hypothetical protein
MIGGWPRRTRWALTTMALCSSWRKISVSSKVMIFRERIRSASTLPGPTDGNWNTSPTRMRVAVTGTARIRWAMSRVSTMEASSTTTTSAARGSSSVRSKWPSARLYPRPCAGWPPAGRSPRTAAGRPGPWVLPASPGAQALHHGGDGADQGGFPGAGTAGDHRHLVGQHL